MQQLSGVQSIFFRQSRVLRGVLAACIAISTLFCVSLCVRLSVAFAAQADGPVLTQWVNDPEQVLSAQDAAALTHKLYTLSQTLPGNPQIAIALPGHVDDIDSYANTAFHNTGLGRKGEDNGVLIVLDIPDRQSRIEVGYGLEGTLTDLQSSDILTAAQPDLRAGHYAQALNGIVDAIADLLQHAEPVDGAFHQAVKQVDPSTDAIEGIVGLVVAVGLFVVLPIILMRRAKKRTMRYPGGYMPPEARAPNPWWDILLNVGLNILSALAQGGGGRRGGGGGRGPSDPFNSGGGDSGGGGARGSW